MKSSFHLAILLLVLGSSLSRAGEDVQDCPDATTTAAREDTLENVDSLLDIEVLNKNGVAQRTGFYWQIADWKHASFCMMITPFLDELTFFRQTLCFQRVRVKDRGSLPGGSGLGWGQSHYTSVRGYSLQGGTGYLAGQNDEFDLDLDWDVVKPGAPTGKMVLHASLHGSHFEFAGKNISPFRLGIRICGGRSKSRCEDDGL